jgi:hypothetical protein
MFMAFGVLLPAGAAVAAFFRDRLIGGVWQAYHLRIQAAGVTFGTIGFIIALSFTQLEGDGQFTTVHSIVGVITMAITVLQVLSAIARPKLEAPGRSLWVAWHRVAGLAVLCGGMAAVALGGLLIGLPPVIVYLYVGVAGTTFFAFAITKFCQTNDAVSQSGPQYTAGTGYKVNDDFGKF